MSADEDEVICRCSGTTASQVRRLIDKGVTDLEGISYASGTASGCGGCESDVSALIAEILSEETER